MPHSLIPKDWELPQELRRRVGRNIGRQRFMNHDGHLLILAHEVPRAEEAHRRGILCWRDADGNWRSSDGTSGIDALDQLLERYEQRLEELDRAEAQAVKAAEYLPVLESAAPVARAAANLYDVLREARKAVPEALELIDFRDRAYELSRSAELAYQYTKDSMDVAVVRRAEEQARASDQMAVASHRLNIMAAVFFPLATLSAVFGTTLTDNWTWSESPYAFLLFVAGGLLVGIVLAVFVSSKPRR